MAPKQSGKDFSGGEQLILFPGSEDNFCLPKYAANDNYKSDVRTGISGEYLTLAKLTRWGFDAHDAPQHAAYDLFVDYAGRVIRIQVKTKTASVGGKWPFRVMRGNWRSATGAYAYHDGDYDIFAGVALGIEKVLFAPGVVNNVTFRTEEYMREHAERESWNWALDEILNSGDAA